MKVAIMQPYFLPYLGYWQLLQEADVFVLFDVVKFKKRSWMPRNRVLHPDPNKEFNYIKLPCNASSDTLISDVSIAIGSDWLTQIQGILSVYRRMNAVNYDLVEQFFKRWAFSGEERFTDFIELQIKDLLPILGSKCQLMKATDIEFNHADVRAPGTWALEIAKALKATTYINPYGGADIFDEELYRINGIDLRFLRSHLTEYPQGNRPSFSSGLSIIDKLMFCEQETLRNNIRQDYELLTKSELIGA